MGLDSKTEAVIQESGQLVDLGKTTEAVQLLTDALEKAESHVDKIPIELELAVLFHDMSRYEDSIEKSRKVIDMIEKRNLEMPEELTTAKIKLGDSLIQRGIISTYYDDENAEMFFREATNVLEEAFRQAQSRYSKFIATCSLGDLYYAKDECERAKSVIGDGFSLCDDEESRYELLVRIGRLETLMGDYQSAIDHYEEGLRIVGSIDDVMMANHLFHMARSYSELNRTDEAIESFRKAIECISQIGSWEAESLLEVCHYGIGHEYMDLDDYEKAIQHFNASYKLALKTGDDPGMSLMMLGEAYCWNNDYNSSLKYLKKALDFVDNQDSRDRINRDINICNRNLK